MENHKTLVLHIGDETFLLAVSQLTLAQVKDIESLAEAAFDDYSDELADMSIYQICQWFQDKVRSMYNIELRNLSIDYEVTMRS